MIEVSALTILAVRVAANNANKDVASVSDMMDPPKQIRLGHRDHTRLFEASEDLLKLIGDCHRAAALHSDLADRLHRVGEEASAREDLRKSAEAFANIGLGSGYFGLWKLTDW